MYDYHDWHTCIETSSSPMNLTWRVPLVRVIRNELAVVAGGDGHCVCTVLLLLVVVAMTCRPSSVVLQTPRRADVPALCPLLLLPGGMACARRRRRHRLALPRPGLAILFFWITLITITISILFSHFRSRSHRLPSSQNSSPSDKYSGRLLCFSS